MSIPIFSLLNDPTNAEAASSSQAEGDQGDLRGRSYKRRIEETNLTLTNVIQSQTTQTAETSSKRLKPTGCFH